MDRLIVMASLEKIVDLNFFESIFSNYKEKYFKLLRAEFPLEEIIPFSEHSEDDYPYVRVIVNQICKSIDNVPSIKNLLPDHISGAKEIIKQLKRNFKNGVYEKHCAPLIYIDYCDKYKVWCDSLEKNHFCCFSSFPFFNFLYGSKQVEYLFKELYIHILRLYIEDDNAVSFLPEEMISHPLFSIGGTDMKLGATVSEDGSVVSIGYENYASDGSYVRVIVKDVPVSSLRGETAEEQEQEIRQKIEELNEETRLTSFDAAVVQTILQHFTAANIENDVQRYIYGHFAEECFRFDRKLYASDFDKLEKSLRKLSNYSIQYEAATLEKEASGKKHVYLVDYTILRDRRREEGMKDFNYSAVLEIYPSRNLKDMWLNAKNYDILTLFYNKVSDPTQRLLLFPLQRERVKALANGINKSVKDFSFFYDMVDYGGDRRAFNRSLKKHLEALCSQQVLIKSLDFYRTKHVVIEWLELSPMEEEVYGSANSLPKITSFD